MSKYNPLDGETANGSINQLWFLRSNYPTWITVVILYYIYVVLIGPVAKEKDECWE